MNKVRLFGEGGANTPSCQSLQMNMETCRETKNKVVRLFGEGGTTLPPARAYNKNNETCRGRGRPRTRWIKGVTDIVRLHNTRQHSVPFPDSLSSVKTISLHGISRIGQKERRC